MLSPNPYQSPKSLASPAEAAGPVVHGSRLQAARAAMWRTAKLGLLLLPAMYVLNSALMIGVALYRSSTGEIALSDLPVLATAVEWGRIASSMALGGVSAVLILGVATAVCWRRPSAPHHPTSLS